jgi:DpnD/PcfM-like protein
METFKIEVQEILSRVIFIEAENQEDAILKINKMYRNEEIVLDAQDYLDTNIQPIISDSLIQNILSNENIDERIKLKEILCLIGISKEKSNLIAIEAGSSQCVVNVDYLISIEVPSYLLDVAMKYINMFYRGEFDLN